MPEKVRLHIGLGASFGFEGATKAALKGDQNNTNSVMDTAKGLGGGAELLGGYKFFFTERMALEGMQMRITTCLALRDATTS